MTVVVPVIGISCCLRRTEVADGDPVHHHAVYEMYVKYIEDILGAAPMLIPAISQNTSLELLGAIANSLDGILLTGSPSNVRLRACATSDDGFIEDDRFIGREDLSRDWTTLRLFRIALDREVPILGICRGMQEMNVARGGSLFRELHLEKGRIDHRSNKIVPRMERYGPAHTVTPIKNSWIEDSVKRLNMNTGLMLVNSLHTQAIESLGTGVSVELIAEDGTIEAIRVFDVKGFAYGVQWHIEWHHDTVAINKVISGAFNQACLDRAVMRATLKLPSSIVNRTKFTEK